MGRRGKLLDQMMYVSLQKIAIMVHAILTVIQYVTCIETAIRHLSTKSKPGVKYKSKHKQNILNTFLFS